MFLTSLTRSLGTTTTTTIGIPCLRRAQFFHSFQSSGRRGLQPTSSATDLKGTCGLLLRRAFHSQKRQGVVASTATSVPAWTLRTQQLSSRYTRLLVQPFSSTSAPSEPRSAAAAATPSTNSSGSEEDVLHILTPPSVSNWLLLSSALVFAIIIVGGVTRLTESGLSITEWRPITGVIPPLTHDEWMEEFEKYKATPEFKLLNSKFTLDDFKRIFYMEWGHRVLGRLIGVSFVFPLIYFIVRRRVSLPVAGKLTSLSVLIGFQGFLGWYMVKSGLEEIEEPGGVPRVSQYRLAAHLGTALALYIGMFGMGLKALREWRWVKSGVAGTHGWSGIIGNQETVEKLLKLPEVKRFRGAALALTGLVMLTALSGAFVAGLDAGLVYNEFPLMGGRLAPPTDELFSDAYAKNLDKSDLWWRNIFENPTTVQFDHRVLAITTYISTTALFLISRRPHIRAVLPPLARTATSLAFAMANIQVILGISTLLYLVPVPLAATHQAGSVALLSAMINLLVTLKRPGMAARFWRAKV